jgi:hypothetical protein
MRRQVVRSVMRALFDESFDSVHAPSSDWLRTMQAVDGGSGGNVGNGRATTRR